MWQGLTLIDQNVGFPLETVIVLVGFLGSLVFFAQDFKLGVLINFVSNGLFFLLFYYLGWSYGIAAVSMFLSLVVLSLTLFFVQKQASQPGGFV